MSKWSTWDSVQCGSERELLALRQFQEGVGLNSGVRQTWISIGVPATSKLNELCKFLNGFKPQVPHL